MSVFHLEEKKEFSIKYRVGFADTDASGIVHFSNYFRFFERAEEAYLQGLGMRYADLAAKYKIWLPRVSATCDYFSPCRDGDEIEVVMSLKRLNEKSIEESFEIKNSTTGKLAAKGELVNVAALADISKSVPIPNELIKLFRSESN
jgi:acyl-CoA thioester hydrolase